MGRDLNVRAKRSADLAGLEEVRTAQSSPTRVDPPARLKIGLAGQRALETVQGVETARQGGLPNVVTLAKTDEILRDQIFDMYGVKDLSAARDYYERAMATPLDR